MTNSRSCLKKTIGIFLLIYDIEPKHFRKESLIKPKTPIALNIARLSHKGCSKWTALLKGRNNQYIQEENSIREAKVNAKLGLSLDAEQWSKIYKNLRTISFDFNYRYLQYRLNRGLLETNSMNLHILNRAHETRCTFCNRELETIKHLLWDCNVTKTFYRDIKTLLFEKWPNFIWIHSLEWLLFGEIGKSHNNSQRIIILLLIRYIYNRKACRQLPNVEGCKMFLYNTLYLLQKAGEVKSTAMNLSFLNTLEFTNIYKKFDVILN